MERKSILFELKEIDLLIARMVMQHSKLLKEQVLSPVQARIINYLFNHKDEKVYQRDLEKVLGLRRSTISGVLQTMEKNNIIKKVEVQEDARIRQIIFTDRMICKEKEMREKFRRIENRLESDISREELEVFLKVIHQIKKNLREGNE